MADSTGKILTLGALAVGGYFVYEWLLKPSAAVVTTPPGTVPAGTPGATTTTTGTGTTTTPPSSTTPAGNTADAVYLAMKAAAATDPNFTGSGDSMVSTPDRWNFYLKRVVPGATIAAPLEPGPNLDTIFPGIDRTLNMTAAAYWAGVAPWVRTTYGLTGLGMFGGLGALIYSRGRR